MAGIFGLQCSVSAIIGLPLENVVAGPMSFARELRQAKVKVNFVTTHLKPSLPMCFTMKKHVYRGVDDVRAV